MSRPHESGPPPGDPGAGALTQQVAGQYLRLAVTGACREYPNVPQYLLTGPADLTLFGWPDPEAEVTRFKLGLPGGYGLLLTNDPSATIVGLDRFRPEDRPPLAIPFLTSRLLVGGGPVEQRRVPGLPDARAEVLVVAPVATPAIAALADGGEGRW